MRSKKKNTAESGDVRPAIQRHLTTKEASSVEESMTPEPIVSYDTMGSP